MSPLIKSIISWTCICAGLGLFVLGFAVKFAIFPAVLQDQIYANLELKEGTETFDAFIEPPVPVYMSFRFFNVTNADKVKSGEKPILEEVGPYVYREVRRKEDVNEVDRDKLNYGLYMEYHFDEEQTGKAGCDGCTKDDPITVLNGVLVGVVGLINQLNLDPDKSFSELAVDLDLDLSALPEEIANILKLINLRSIYGFLNNVFAADNEKYAEDVFVTTSVNELLYEGYSAKLLHALGYVGDALAGQFGVNLGFNLEEMLCSLAGSISPQISNCEFGVFKGKNATKAKSYYTVNNGRYEKYNFLMIEKFNGQTSLPENWWPKVGPTPSASQSGMTGICHDIYGNDGTLFPPFVEKDERKWLFVSELCRSIWLDFDQEVEVNGIKAYRYRPPFSVFNMRNPDNYCYCPEFNECAKVNETADVWIPDDCYQHCKDGFLRVGDCYGGLPVIMSAPHYWYVDDSIKNQTQGLEANKDKHDTYLDIEPMTGVALAAHKRIQINFPMQAFEFLDITSNLPKVELFPVLWADEGADLDQENEDKFKSMILTPINVVNGLSIGMGIVLGALLFIFGVYMASRKCPGKTNSSLSLTQPIITKKELE